MAQQQQCNLCRAYNPVAGLCTKLWIPLSFDGEPCTHFDDKNVEKKVNEEDKAPRTPDSQKDTTEYPIFVKRNSSSGRRRMTEKESKVQESENKYSGYIIKKTYASRTSQGRTANLRSILELKDDALTTLKGRWGSALLFSLTAFMLTACWMLPYFYFYWIEQDLLTSYIVYYGGGLLFYAVLTYGIMNAFVIAARVNESLKIIHLFMGFEDFGIYFKVVWQALVTVFFLLLWMLLLIVPGIIKMYSYAMVLYIRRDFPDMTANEVIEHSKKMMMGHKWKLFLLHLSFIGWYIVGILTFFIGFIWILPYVFAAQAQFYEDIKGS